MLSASLTAAQDSPGPGLGLVDAVRLTLERQPGIKLAEEQVRFVNGSLQATLGAFDVRFGSALSRVHDTSPVIALTRPGAGAVRTDAWSYDVFASKLFRSGLVLTPSITLARQSSNLSSLVENRSRVGFTVRQPLLRGRGADGVEAPSRSAKLEVDAASLDLRHVVSLSVLETVSGYWRYLAEVQRLQIARDSENRFVDLQSSAAKLLAAREIAAVDIKQLSAVVASRRLSRLDAEQRVNDARARLGLSAGLDAVALSSVGAPTDTFPAADATAAVDLAPWIREALAARADLQAARLRQQSAGVAVGAAENAARPALDLEVGTSYAGGVNRTGLPGFLDPLVNNLSGPSASASLTFGWPNSNRTALGRLAENRALLRQSEISLADLERRIGGQVAIALNDLVKSAARVAASKEACDLYRETLAAERQRQQLGLSSLLDVINTEDRLTDSLFEAVSADLDYAQAIAVLRHEMGALVRPGASGYEVDLATLTAPPKVDPTLR